MCLETLNSRKKKYFLYALIMGVVVLLPLVLSITFGKYQTKESIKLAEGTISYKPYDFKVMAMYQKNDSGAYEEINSIPTNGYVINEEKSYCTLDNINKDSNAILKTIGNEHSIKNISPNDKCYLYFDKVVVSNIQDIINSKTISRRIDFSTTLTEDTTGTIFVAPDDYGNSFYYAGAVQDNWVKFAGFYWRIIRINGDGTLRMIYQGSAPNITGTGTHTSINEFNPIYNNNMYVGYMYSNNSVHGVENHSPIKEVLDTWYNNNLSEYSKYIATGNDAIFCNDRQPSTVTSELNGYGGTGTTNTYYAAYIRLNTNKEPTLECADSEDKFNISIGLITADEIIYAGGVYGIANSKYYLYTGENYWTLTPYYYKTTDGACVFVVHFSGQLYWGGVFGKWPVRPVINLKSDITFLSGDGTASNPYIVSET